MWGGGQAQGLPVREAAEGAKGVVDYRSGSFPRWVAFRNSTGQAAGHDLAYRTGVGGGHARRGDECCFE